MRQSEAGEKGGDMFYTSHVVIQSHSTLREGTYVWGTQTLTDRIVVPKAQLWQQFGRRRPRGQHPRRLIVVEFTSIHQTAKKKLTIFENVIPNRSSEILILGSRQVKDNQFDLG
jgi:hypothetical protein